MTTCIEPMLAANAAVYAIKNATVEGQTTVVVLLALSLFSWTIIISKYRQLLIARRVSKRFLEAYNSTRDPLDIQRKGDEFEGAPAYQLYIRGADELAYQLKNNPVTIRNDDELLSADAIQNAPAEFPVKTSGTKISVASLEAVKVILEESAGAQAMALEKGMIVLSTAVAGGPFIGLLGTVWGVMSTFAGIAESNSASLTAMAPGVAAALVATVAGLLVAIPAMFAYNFMVTSIRQITQELDGFVSRYANQIEHIYVDHRPLAEEIRQANEVLADRITGVLSRNSQASLAAK